MADLKRKQLKEFLSGSFGITGSLNVTGSVEFDKNISGSLTSTGSFSRIVGDTISVSNTIFASGSEVQTIMDATGSYASSSTAYLMESQTGSFATGSDVQGILDTYVRQSESSSFASGSDLQPILAESASYVVSTNTGSFASGSDLHTILAQSASYVTLDETGSFASGSDLHTILAQSASYVMSTNTGSYLQNSDTASLATLHVEGNITTSGSVTAQQFHTEVVSSSIIYESGSTQFGDSLDDTHRITGSLQITGSSLTIDDVGGVSGSITSTGSFGKLELVDSVHISPFASGSDVQIIQAESASYVVSTNTGSYASGSSVQTILDDYAKGTEISGSYLGLLSGSNDLTLGLGVSASLASTASFGSVQIAGNALFREYISHRGDSDTFIRFEPDKISIEVGGENMIYIVEGADGNQEDKVTINNDLADVDFQVKGDNIANLIRTDAANDKVGIGPQSPSEMLHISGSGTTKLFVEGDISGSLTSTGSFGRVDVADNTFILGNLGVGTNVVGQKLQVDGDTGITGQLDVSGSVSGGLASTGSFGWVEELGVKLVNSNQTASFASGSDLHTILAQSASYMISDQTGSMGATTMNSTLFVEGDITTSGSVIAREFKTEFVSSSIIYASGSNKFGDTGDDVHEFSGSLKIGNLTFSTSSIGVQSDTDLISLSDDTFTLNGSIVINDGANIGIDSDTNLLDLNDQNLIVNGILDSTGRIDAQSGLQVSGSSLAVGNDLTLNYTSPVSHSLMFVNYTNKTVDLVPVASASGQLVQFNGTTWIITDEIDGGSF